MIPCLQNEYALGHRPCRSVAAVTRGALRASAVTRPALAPVGLTGLGAARFARLAAHAGAVAELEPTGSVAPLARSRTVAGVAAFAAAGLVVRSLPRAALPCLATRALDRVENVLLVTLVTGAHATVEHSATIPTRDISRIQDQYSISE